MAVKKAVAKTKIKSFGSLKIVKPQDTLVATPSIAKKVSLAKEIKGQIRMLEKQFLAVRKELEEKIGEHEILADKTGVELVTWKRGKDRQDLDKKLLEADFPDVYDACKVTMPGNRVFSLK